MIVAELGKRCPRCGGNVLFVKGDIHCLQCAERFFFEVLGFGYDCWKGSDNVKNQETI